MNEQKPARHSSTASNIITGIIAIIIFAALFVPLGVWLTRLALGG